MRKILFLVFLTLQFAIAQGEEAAQFPPGQVVERIVSRSNPEMSYALYLPAKYSASNKWPLLVAMDPRGRALIPMELYRETAEKLGYIVVSSYDTLSDAAWTPNVTALKAIMADIPAMFAIDDRRIYLSGFSGTAMGGWSFANNMTPHVAGLINFGGAVYDWSKPVRGAVYSFFGAAGTRDFNYEEMRTLEKTLAELELPHRILYFEGLHEWGPKAVCAEGLEWMELQAMKSGLRPRDSSYMGQAFQARMEKAQSLEKSQLIFDAYREYRSIERDFSGIQPVETVSAKVKTLADSKAVKETVRKMDELAEDQQEFVKKLFAFLDEAHLSTGPEQEQKRLNDMKIASLQKLASNTDQPLEALWAQRMLEIAFVQTSFYIPRNYFRSNDARRALKVIAVAEKIHPDSPRLLYMKAWACVVQKDPQKAVQYLAEMAKANAIPSADALAEDENFASLKDNPAFNELLQKLRTP